MEANKPMSSPDIPKELRRLADEIEKKREYILGAALVIDSSVSGINTFYIGAANENHHGHVLLSAGAANMLKKTTDRWY